MPDFVETRDAENNLNEPQASSLEQILPAHSAAVYREFQAGRVIVRDVWDTNRSDIDLWVITPTGEKIYYQHRRGRHGGALFGDVTTGYGPESFTAKHAIPGTYQIKVHYYGTSRRRFTEARGEVVVILHEGTTRERRHVLPYRMFKRRQLVHVGKITVKRAGGAS